jgi:predicted unusual protein kinase regulating ubiquinone biosynthesis (AarF/ABC1/UbiB family)
MSPAKNQSGQPGTSTRWRFIKAYGTAFSILSRYLVLLLSGKFVSADTRQNWLSAEHRRTAEKLAAALLVLKGIYIKLGQTMSIMGNVLPVEFTEGFEQLQDAVPPHPFAEVNARILQDLGQPAQTLFASIEEVPIASASLGQVHVAQAHSGEKLAVKIQYPGIEELTRNDLKTIRRIVSIVHFFFPQFNLKAVIAEAAKVVVLELDYLVEADNIQKIAANFTGDARYVFPTVHSELSSAKVLTTSFIEGAKVTDQKKLAEFGVSPSQLARDLIEFYCKQIFQDGFYHADPHPGNIIITPNGKIAMVDFGAVASVSPAMRKGMTLFVEGLIKRDTKILGQAVKAMGFVSRADNEETLEKVVEYFYSKISSLKIENFNNLNFSQFQELNDLVELRKIDVSISDLTSLFLIPKDWILLERTILLMMGLTAQLDETLNPVDIVIPYVETFLLGKDRSMKDLLITASKDLLVSYIGLPGELNKTLKKLNAGQLTMQLPDLRRELSGIKSGIAQLGCVLLAIAGGLLSHFSYRAGLFDQGLRFEYGSYAFALAFVYFLMKR